MLVPQPTVKGKISVSISADIAALQPSDSKQGRGLHAVRG